jgi:hypothetical protein
MVFQDDLFSLLVFINIKYNILYALLNLSLLQFRKY